MSRSAAFCQRWLTPARPTASESGVRLAQNGWKLARAFLWEYSCRRLKLAQLLGQLGIFLTCPRE
jgi:hypothetical protein